MVGRGDDGQQRGMCAVERNAHVQVDVENDRDDGQSRQMSVESKKSKVGP
jgi:hypothetical protein